MATLVRKTYPAGFSIGLLILVAGFIFMLSQQIFDVPFSELNDHETVYIGMLLVTIAVIIMILIIWEEILFPIRIKEVNGGMQFHNHRQKIRTQMMIYMIIPIICAVIYFNFELNLFRFVIWAAIVIFLPILEKLASGIKNYNDFLRLTDTEIEYKDNEKVGLFKTADIQKITLITHKKDVTHQIELTFKNNDVVTIDLHEMELEAFYDAIYVYMNVHYIHFLKETVVD